MQSHESYFSRAGVIKRFWWKWLVCSWLHYKHRCYEWHRLNTKYRGWFEHWHCVECHPCDEALDSLEVVTILLNKAKEDLKLQKQIDALTPSNADPDGKKNQARFFVVSFRKLIRYFHAVRVATK